MKFMRIKKLQLNLLKEYKNKKLIRNALGGLLVFAMLILSGGRAIAFTHKSVGLFLGEPLSITGKAWKSNIEAYQLGLSLSTSYSFYIFGDYHYHFLNQINSNELFFQQLQFYVGGGGFIINTKSETNRFGVVTKESKMYLGARVPLGVEWRPKFPMSVYIEFTPGISIVPEMSSYTSGGIGIRYIF